MYPQHADKAIPQENKPNTRRIYRARLRDLFKARCKIHDDDPLFLSDDTDGRAMLTTLICFGVKEEDSANYGPWCEAEFAMLKRRARRMNWDRDIGKLIKLTTDEWKDFKLYALRPADKSPSEFEKWRKERKKEKAKVRKANQRAQEKTEREAMKLAMKLAIEKEKLTARENALWKVIVERCRINGMVSAPELIKEAAKLQAFTHPRYHRTTWCNGPPARAIVRNLPNVVHRTLNGLERKGAIRTHNNPA
jgi:hypothetical protein